MLCASIWSWYTDAGLRPEMMNLLCGFKALDTVTFKPVGHYLDIVMCTSNIWFLGKYIIFSNSFTDTSNWIFKAKKYWSIILETVVAWPTMPCCLTGAVQHLEEYSVQIFRVASILKMEVAKCSYEALTLTYKTTMYRNPPDHSTDTHLQDYNVP
jgi:hypothetical protein